MTIEMLLARFAERSDQPALAIGESCHTYGDLLREVKSRAVWLTKQDVPPGIVAALVADFSFDGIALLLALWWRRCIVVPMSRPMVDRMSAASTEYIISPRAAIASRRIASHRFYETLREVNEPGLVLFTSGSTGQPKAVVHDVGRWFEKLSRPGRRQRTLAFLSFDHIGGLNTLLYAFANGGMIVCPADRSPEQVWMSIVRWEAELLPTTPTFLRLLLLSGIASDVKAPSLKLIAYGSEPMPEETLTAIRSLLPHVQFLQQYGMSELGVLRSRSREDGSTWLRLGGPEFKTRVVDGLLEVKADTAMLGYLNAPDPFTADGWLRTGDEVEVDGDFIRIIGRRSEVINVGGEKVHPAEVEARLESLRGVTCAVVRGEHSNITGQIVVAAVHLSTDETLVEFRTRMRAELSGKLPKHQLPQKVVVLTEGIGERQKKVRAA